MSDTQEIKVLLRDQMHFEGYTGDGDDFAIPMDANESVGGQGKGSRPQKLLLVSLAGCSGMDVISILRKKRQDVTGMEVRVRGERADEHPRVYTQIWVTFVVTGKQVDAAAVERAIELSMTRYCPVAALLQEMVPIETSYEIVEG